MCAVPPSPFNSYYITNSYYINDKNNDKEDEINIYNDVNNVGDNSGNNNDENLTSLHLKQTPRHLNFWR